MALPAVVVRTRRALGRLARALGQLPRLALRWLRSNAMRLVAMTWLGGMSGFAYVTVRRAQVIRRAEAAQAQAQAEGAIRPNRDGSGEVLAMLDVDEMNQIRADRMHALGLAAAGDSTDPDDDKITAARAARGTATALEGETVAVKGNIVVVTKGGIAGWLKRNRGKKADPETLAWLRSEEAADGRETYGGWADRDDADVLAWSKGRRHGVAAGEVPTTTAGLAPSEVGSEVGSDGGPAPPAAGSDAAAAPADDAAPITAPIAAPITAPIAAPPRGFDLRGLGEAAASALGDARSRAAAAAVDPTPAELAALRRQLGQLVDDGTLTLEVRDHHAVLLLLADHVFRDDAPELTPSGRQAIRELGRQLRAVEDRAYRLRADPERAMELASTMVVAGLAPSRLDIKAKDVDRAIDLIELELVPVPPRRRGGGGRP